MGIGKKEDSILEDAREADVVFSLGNKIFDHFENQFRAIPASKRPRHFKFVPRPSKIYEDAEAEYKHTETMVVVSVGGVSGEILKGYDLATEALSIVADKMKIRYRVIGVDKDDFETIKAIREHCKTTNLQITFLPYGTQKDICKEMMQAHLVLMPSRAEPFGLVGLEAIAAGIPVLVSNKSGLADFIHEHVDELHHSIVDMDESEEGIIVKYLARSIERVLKHNSTEFETAARCRKKLLSSKYWEESQQRFIKACTDTAKNVTQKPVQIHTRSRDEDATVETFGGRKRPKPGISPPLPIVMEILAQVKPTVKTPKELLSYASAKRTFVTLDLTADETLELLEQIKPEIKTMEDLLDTTEAIRQLEEIKGVDVPDFKMGSLVFYLQCTDLDGLGELWFMYKRGKLDKLLHSSLVRKETLQLLCAESISVKTTIKLEDFKKALLYLLTTSDAKGQRIPRLPQEYPLYQQRLHTASNVLDVLHLDHKKLPKVCGEHHLQEMPLPIQGEDGEDDILDKLGDLQIADRRPEETPEDMEVQEINSTLKLAGASIQDDQQATEPIDDTDAPQISPELASLDIRELERLMKQPRKRRSSMDSDSSGYVSGTPASGPSRSESPTDEHDAHGTLESLFGELNTSAVMGDKAQQFDLYCQIGDLYRTKLHNLQSALQYYQNMLECSQALSDDRKQATAHSRLGLTCDMLGLQEEAHNNHEMTLLALVRVVTGRNIDISVAYKNMASTLALSGKVSDAKRYYESALAVAMETGNKTEQMDIYCKLGDLHMVQLHEPQVSRGYYTVMLAQARDLGSKAMEGLAYNRLGRACEGMQEYEAALEWHQKALKMSQYAEVKKKQIRANIDVGGAYRMLGKLDQATSHYNTALQMAQQTGDQHGQVMVHLTLGEMHREQLHSPRTAIQYYEQSLDLARQVKARRDEGLAYNRLGKVHYEMGEYETALGWSEKFLKVSQDNEDTEGQITAHTEIGDVYRFLDELDEATSHFNTALQMAQQTGDQHGQMDVYLKMGDMYREQLHSAQTAIQHYKQSLDLARQLKARREEGLAYNRLGQVHYGMGEYEAALRWEEKFLKVSQDYEDTEGRIRAHTNIGGVYSLLGKLDQATFHFNTALQMAQQTGDQHGQMRVYFKIGDIHREQLHSPHTAIRYYEQALDLAKQLNSKREEELAYDRLGVSNFNIGEYEAGLEWFQKALKIQEDTGVQGTTHPGIYPKPMSLNQYGRTSMMVREMKMCFQTGEMHREQLHSPRKAIQFYEQALKLARQLKDRHEEGLASDRLGRVYFELRDYEKALEWYQKYLKMKEEDKDKKAQITAHKNIAKSYKKLGKKDLAKSQYQSAMTIAMETGDKQQQDDIGKKIGKL